MKARIACGRRHPRLCLVPILSFLPLFLLILSSPPSVEGGPLDNIDCDPCIERSRYEIKAIVHGTKDDLVWQQVQAAMTQVAKDMGIHFEMELREQYDPLEMARDILDTIRYKPDNSDHGHTHNVHQIDGLIVTIPDPIVEDAVKQALAAGIHVWGFNEGYQVAREAGLMGYVAQNEYMAGQFAAEQFLQRQYKLTQQPLKAVFVNHNPNSTAFKERFQGFNDTLTLTAGIFPEELVVDPHSLYDFILDVNQEFEACDYDFVLLAGTETVSAVKAAVEHHACDGQPIITSAPQTSNTNYSLALEESSNSTTLAANNTRRMLIGAFGETIEIMESIARNELEFTFTQQMYLQSVLPVIMATTYASTGKRLEPPGDQPVYFSGPKLVDITNLPTDTFMTCQTEAFPICPNKFNPRGEPAECECEDRHKLRIAGVVHGLEGDHAWDTVFSAAVQASSDMQVDLIMERQEQQQDDQLLYHQMATKIRDLCSSGIDGIFVSMPSSQLKSSVQFCQSLDIPVIVINTGEEFAKELGIQYIGQMEYQAGKQSGNRLIEAGMKVGYCLRQAVSTALDQRCLGFADSIEATGGNVTFGGVITIPQDNMVHFKTIVENVVGRGGNWTGIAFLANGPIEPLLNLQWYHQLAMIGAFDTRPEIFEYLDNYRVLFAIDQQQYLQGSMPVYLLTYAAYTKQALLNRFIETGPKLVYYSPPKALQVCEQNGYQVCAGIPEEDFNYIGSFLKIFGYLAIVLVLFMALVVLIWMQVNRGKNIVRASQPLFLGLVVMGTVILTSSIIPYGAETGYRYVKDSSTGLMTTQENPDIKRVDAACMLGPWLYGVGFAITFSALCAKIWRVKLVYEAGMAMQRKQAGISDVLFIMGGVLAVELALLLCWTLISPSKWERTVQMESGGYVLESTGQCTSDPGKYFAVAQVGFHVLCGVYALFLSWQTRELPSEFAESSWISLAVVCIFQVNALAIPIGWMTKDDGPSVHYLLFVAATFLQTFTVLCLIFVPKMLRVMSGNDGLPVSHVAGRSIGQSGGANKFSNDPDGVPATSSGLKYDTEKAPPPADSGTGSDESEEVGSPSGDDYVYKRTEDLESAPDDRFAAAMAPLEFDSDSDSESPMSDMLKDYNASSSKPVESAPNQKACSDIDNDLDHLEAELSRAEETRNRVFSAVAGRDPPGPNADNATRAMSLSSASSGTPSYEGSVEAANATTFNNHQSSTDGDSSDDSSSDNGNVMQVGGAETQSPKRAFPRRDSDDADASGSSSDRGKVTPKKPSALSILEGSFSSLDKAARSGGIPPEVPQNTLEVDTRGKTDGARSGATEASDAPRRRYERRGSPDVDSSVESSSHDDALNYEKNPQEGSLVSHENSSGSKPATAANLPTPASNIAPNDNVDTGSISASTSTAQSTQGISQARASEAEIFRKPYSTPVRLKKNPSEYGDLTAIATGLSRTSSSFLRKVAASLSSGDISQTTRQASFGSTSLRFQQPTSSKIGVGAHTQDIHKTHHSEFSVDRQDRAHYQVLKNSSTNGDQANVDGTLQDLGTSTSSGCNQDGNLYFS